MSELVKNRILKHKKNRVYLKLFSDGFKHYVVDINEASRFDSVKARAVLKKFKHPENWEIIKEPISAAKKDEKYKCTRRGTNKQQKKVMARIIANLDLGTNCIKRFLESK